LPVSLLSLNILWTKHGDVLGRMNAQVKICFFFSLTSGKKLFLLCS
jgi:hypothetical protein